ncbi:MAG: hypothetical protein Q9163_005428 [Psora crenata]
MGSLVCERIETTPPTDALATWEEHDCTYIIREAEDVGIASPPFVESSDDVQLVYEMGTGSAVWTIGRQFFCKVKKWEPALESEGKTIAFVKEIAPLIPTPEVIYTWAEKDRSFLIMKRMEGSTLRDAWLSLSPSQRNAITTTIASYCDVLAQNTSPTLRGLSGKPLHEPYLAPYRTDFCGPYTREECARHFSSPSGECPPLGEVFHFYHADLGPGNIIVSDGKVAGIIDWESAGYYPRFWISTKPSVSPGFDFCPSVEGFIDGEWRRGLRIELERWGYPAAGEWYMKWFRLKRC